MPRPRKQPPPPEPPKRRPYGTGSIAVSANGTIRARLPARIDPRRTAREFPPGHLADAEAWLDAALNPPPPPEPDTDVTLGDWAGRWWETYVKPIHPPNTSKWYLYAVQQLAPLYATPLVDVRPSALQAVVGTLSQRVEAVTVQALVGVWRRCLDAAIDDELIARNPAKRLTLPKVVRKPPARRITPQEAHLLREAIVGHRYEAAYALMLGCGLRIGEILGLHWRDVDLPNRRAWIQHQFTNGHWRPMPKGNNPHWVPLPSFVVAALIRHRDGQPAGTTLVMQSPYGHWRRGQKHSDEPWPIGRTTVAEDLHALVASLKLDPLTPRAGRHGLASALIEGGASPAVVAERLGHADPAVTLRRYTQGSAEGRKQADAMVETYLSGTAPGAVSGGENTPSG